MIRFDTRSLICSWICCNRAIFMNLLSCETEHELRDLVLLFNVTRAASVVPNLVYRMPRSKHESKIDVRTDVAMIRSDMTTHLASGM